jgi:hypothetical protein
MTIPSIERRRHRRYQAAFKVHCSRIGKENLDAEVDAVDVSLSGLRIIAPRGVAAGDVLSLVLNPPDPVRTTGIVVACRPAYDVRGSREAHIAFTRVNASVQQGIEKLIGTSAPTYAD